MASLFGHSWVSQYGAAPDGIGGDTWSAVLAGLTNQQIALGLQKLSRIPSDWPPTAPKFRSLCLAIPSLAEVRIELALSRSPNWKPTPFARQVWSYIDGFRYRQSPADIADRMLRDAYELAVGFVMDGGELPVPAEALTKQEPATEASDAPPAADSIEGIRRALCPEAYRTIQDELADLERESADDFRRTE